VETAADAREGDASSRLGLPGWQIELEPGWLPVRRGRAISPRRETASRSLPAQAVAARSSGSSSASHEPPRNSGREQLPDHRFRSISASAGEPLNAENSRVVIFVHVPRTAGTTLARILTRQYPASGVLRLYESWFGEELAGLPTADIDRLRAVLSHFYFGAHIFVPRQCAYITLLRDPIERVISHYYYVRQSAAHEFHESARKLNLREFLEYCSDDDQTRQMAGKCGVPHLRTDPDEMLETAKRNLSDFAAVGITEDFDRSVILMKRVLGWNYPFYTSQNITQDRPRKEELPQESLDAAREHNQLDLELYRYAKELFREQVRAQGHAFESELRTFKRMNAAYGPVERVVSSARRMAAKKIPGAARGFRGR